MRKELFSPTNTLIKCNGRSTWSEKIKPTRLSGGRGMHLGDQQYLLLNFDLPHCNRILEITHNLHKTDTHIGTLDTTIFNSEAGWTVSWEITWQMDDNTCPETAFIRNANLERNAKSSVAPEMCNNLSLFSLAAVVPLGQPGHNREHCIIDLAALSSWKRNILCSQADIGPLGNLADPQKIVSLKGDNDNYTLMVVCSDRSYWWWSISII